MDVSTHNTSFAIIPAKEVLRMALASIREIEEGRRRAINMVVEEALKRKCSHFFGLYTHALFKDRDDVMERCAAIEHAKNFAGGAMETSETLRQLATYLLDNDKIPEEQKVIHLSAADFKVLT